MLYNFWSNNFLIDKLYGKDRVFPNSHNGFVHQRNKLYPAQKAIHHNYHGFTVLVIL